MIESIKDNVREFVKEGIDEVGIIGTILVLSLMVGMTLGVIAIFALVWWPLLPIIGGILAVVAIVVAWANDSE